MNRKLFYDQMSGEGTLDYELYLNTKNLLSCQSKFEELCNADELQFQIVHQVEELWMKLIAYTLLDIDDYLQQQNTNRVLTLFRRVHTAQRLMINQIALLEIMSPKEYQAIRERLGNGSGQESPGFRVLLHMPPELWSTYEARYLTNGRTVSDVYDDGYSHDDAYVVAEAMIGFDELFQKFRAHHMFLIFRSIGIGSKSLKGRPIELLQAGVRHRFFPSLWDVRGEMTDAWGAVYGVVRESLGAE
jgi:tryptophan 2,3-dioxygenase